MLFSKTQFAALFLSVMCSASVTASSRDHLSAEFPNALHDCEQAGNDWNHPITPSIVARINARLFIDELWEDDSHRLMRRERIVSKLGLQAPEDSYYVRRFWRSGRLSDFNNYLREVNDSQPLRAELYRYPFPTRTTDTLPPRFDHTWMTPVTNFQGGTLLGVEFANTSFVRLGQVETPFYDQKLPEMTDFNSLRKWHRLMHDSEAPFPSRQSVAELRDIPSLYVVDNGLRRPHSVSDFSPAIPLQPSLDQIYLGLEGLKYPRTESLSRRALPVTSTLLTHFEQHRDLSTDAR